MSEKNNQEHSVAARKQRRANLQSGQAILELVLVLPILLMLTLGVIEFGRAAYYDIAVSDAARAGAQYASQNLANASDSSGILQAALNNSLTDIGPGLSLTNPPKQFCACPGGGVAGGCPASGCAYPIVYVTVTTSYPFSPLFNYPGISPSFTMNGSSTLPVQRQ